MGGDTIENKSRSGCRGKRSTLGKVYLERVLSKLGIMSRSETRKLIVEGRLSVNGRVIKDPEFLVVPEDVELRVDGERLKRVSSTTIVLNKPKGYVTTRRDEKGRKTVYDLLPHTLQHLHPVGRLDMNTTGLLLLTTDTKLSSYLTDPVNVIERVYVVTVEGKVTDQEKAQLEQGIEDKGEILRANEITLRKVSNKESHLIVTLTEGKNREIRRMFAALGHEVTALKRIQFGEYQLGILELGKYRNA